jgi:hypothetical protein
LAGAPVPPLSVGVVGWGWKGVRVVSRGTRKERKRVGFWKRKSTGEKETEEEFKEEKIGGKCFIFYFFFFLFFSFFFLLFLFLLFLPLFPR